jgi:DNA processing protein
MKTILSWFALKNVEGIGNHFFKRLIDRFELPEQVFNASDEELLEVEGMSLRLINAIRRHSISDRDRKEAALAVQKGYGIVTLSDPEYPPLLLGIADPPPFFYVFGKLGASAENIAVVGSRSPTRYGISAASQLSGDLASLKITVVSGMARGIDTAAHEGALKSGGRTVAVLGSGLEQIYPSENEKLFHRIAENGAVISEFPLNARPEAYHFPIRNRVISGMSLGTVVVEAGQRSGALITARFAAEQGREVFAVPGNIRSFKSSGTHKLIKAGAKLVENAKDITEELPELIQKHLAEKKISSFQKGAKDTLPPLLPEELAVFNSLGPYPVHIDDLIRKLSMEPGKLSGILLQLELKGIVRQSPGKLFSTE